LGTTARGVTIRSTNSVAHTLSESLTPAFGTFPNLYGGLADNLEAAFLNYGIGQHFLGNALDFRVRFFARDSI
jgi:hypothetical protein